MDQMGFKNFLISQSKTYVQKHNVGHTRTNLRVPAGVIGEG